MEYRMSRLVVDTLQGTTSGGNRVSVPAGHTLYAPGHVIQVVHNSITVPTSVSIPSAYATHTNIPDFFATITPKSVSSKIYVMVRWFGEFSPNNASWNTMFGVKRNGTAVGLNPSNAGTGGQGISMAALSYNLNDNDSTPEMMYFDYYDTPSSVSALTYQVYASAVTASTLFTNRTVNTVAGGYEYGRSNITLMEIAG
jgi:hypothetical protein